MAKAVIFDEDCLFIQFENDEVRRKRFKPVYH